MSVEPAPESGEEKLSAKIGLGLGLFLVTVGLWAYNNDVRERAMSRETEGTIVDHVSRRERDYKNDRYETTYAPVIEFMVNDDRTRFTGQYDTRISSKGNKVTVRYDPSSPVDSARVIDPLAPVGLLFALGMGGSLAFSSLKTLIPIRLKVFPKQPSS